MPKVKGEEEERMEAVPLGGGEASERRKTPHVSKACSNCQKGHTACDNQRPCGRCLRAGKEQTCVDVEQRKRGWRKGRARGAQHLPREEADSQDDSSNPSSPQGSLHSDPLSDYSGRSPTSISPPSSSPRHQDPNCQQMRDMSLSDGAPPGGKDNFVVVISLGGIILEHHGSSFANWGYPPNSLIGYSFFDFLAQSDRQVVQKVLNLGTEVPNMTSFNLLFRFVKSNGIELVWVEVKAQMETSERHSSSTIRMTGAECDSSYYYQGDEPQGVNFGAFTLKSLPDGRCVDVTEGITFSLGYHKSDVKGKWIMELIHPQDLLVANSAQGKMVSEKGSCALRMRVKAKDGRYIWMQSNARTVQNPITGTVEWMMCHFQPVRKTEGTVLKYAQYVCQPHKTKQEGDQADRDGPEHEDGAPLSRDQELLLQENRRLAEELAKMREVAIENETLKLQLKTLQEKMLQSNLEPFLESNPMSEFPLDSYHSAVSNFDFL